MSIFFLPTSYQTTQTVNDSSIMMNIYPCHNITYLRFSELSLALLERVKGGRLHNGLADDVEETPHRHYRDQQKG